MRENTRMNTSCVRSSTSARGPRARTIRRRTLPECLSQTSSRRPWLAPDERVNELDIFGPWSGRDGTKRSHSRGASIARRDGALDRHHCAHSLRRCVNAQKQAKDRLRTRGFRDKNALRTTASITTANLTTIGRCSNVRWTTSAWDCPRSRLPSSRPRCGLEDAGTAPRRGDQPVVREAAAMRRLGPGVRPVPAAAPARETPVLRVSPARREQVARRDPAGPAERPERAEPQERAERPERAEPRERAETPAAGAQPGRGAARDPAALPGLAARRGRAGVAVAQAAVARGRSLWTPPG